MDLGNKIKILRKENNLTQKELGKLIGKSEISIRKYESGNNIPFDVLKDICKTLNTNITRLIPDIHKEDDPLDSLQNYLFDRGCFISDKEFLKEIEDHILEYVKFKLYEKNKNN